MSAKIKVTKKKNNSKKRKKPCLAVDMDALIVMSDTKWNSRLKRYAKMWPVSKITGRKSAEDLEVYSKCNKKDFHVLTRNYKDYKNFPKIKKDSGIISYPDPLNDNVIDRLEYLVKSNDHEYFKGKVIIVDGEGIKIKKNLASQ